jgi:hypothetical protein
MVQQRSSHSGTFKTLKAVTTDSRGFFTSSAARGTATREWRLKWTDADGRSYTPRAICTLGRLDKQNLLPAGMMMISDSIDAVGCNAMNPGRASA